MEKSEDKISKIKYKISVKKNEELEHELKKWEIESTKGGKLNRSTQR